MQSSSARSASYVGEASRRSDVQRFLHSTSWRMSLYVERICQMQYSRHHKRDPGKSCGSTTILMLCSGQASLAHCRPQATPVQKRYHSSRYRIKSSIGVRSMAHPGLRKDSSGFVVFHCWVPTPLCRKSTSPMRKAKEDDGFCCPTHRSSDSLVELPCARNSRCAG